MDFWHGVRLSPSGCVVAVELPNNGLKGVLLPLNLASLEVLNLNGNQLDKGIPNFDLPNLKVLSLRKNLLMGPIPTMKLPQLVELDLGVNKLDGTLPKYDQKNLKIIRLDSNSIGGAVLQFQLRNLTHLVLEKNNLAGPIPKLNLPNLEVLNLARNKLIVPLPAFKFTKLKVLNLAENRFNTDISKFDYDDLDNLEVLDISQCGLRGKIPKFDFRNLKYLNLGANALTNSIPQFNAPQLEYLILSYNQLTGSVPKFGLKTLIEVDIRYNKLNGSLFAQDLPNLKYFRLSNNGLIGEIPKMILPQLMRLNLSNNQFTALAAQDFPNMGKNPLDSLSIQNNQLTFKDLIVNQELIKKMGTEAYYAPQGPIYPDTTIFVQEGRNFRLNLGLDPQVTDNLYQWYKNARMNGTAGNINILAINNFSARDTGIYKVEVSNPNFRLLTLNSRNIRLRLAKCPNGSSPQLTSSNRNEIICPGTEVTLTAIGGLKYRWSEMNLVSNSIVVRPQESTTYTVSVDRGGGCTDSLGVRIQVFKRIETTLILEQGNCHIELSARISGGLAPFTYRWSDGQTNSRIVKPKMGELTLTIQDQMGCYSSKTINISEFHPFLLEKPEVRSANCDQSDGQIAFKFKPDRGPFSIKWLEQDEGEGENPRIGLAPGFYMAYISDKMGCMDTIEATVGNSQACDDPVEIFNSFSPNGDGVNDVFVIKAKSTDDCPSGDLSICFPNNQLMIIAKTGDRVYEATNYQSDWDAHNVPAGTYWLRFHYDPQKRPIVKELTILR
jgi:hypothetical protein